MNMFPLTNGKTFFFCMCMLKSRVYCECHVYTVHVCSVQKTISIQILICVSTLCSTNVTLEIYHYMLYSNMIKICFSVLLPPGCQNHHSLLSIFTGVDPRVSLFILEELALAYLIKLGCKKYNTVSSFSISLSNTILALFAYYKRALVYFIFIQARIFYSEILKLIFGCYVYVSLLKSEF